MTPGSQIRTSQLLEWDSPWSLRVLLLGFAIVAAWSLWQIIRECRVSGSRWGILFILLRGVICSVLLWMLLGPTSVAVRQETRPRTLAVYVDTSSSMSVKDPPDNSTDQIWNTSIIDSGSRLALFAAAMRTEAAHLAQLVQHQSAVDDFRKSVARWNVLSTTCDDLLREAAESSSVTENADRDQQKQVLSDLTAMLRDELRPMMNDTDWLHGDDHTERNEQLAQLQERCEMFCVQCQLPGNNWRQSASTETAASQESASETTPPISEMTRLQRVLTALKVGMEAWTSEGDGNFRIQVSRFSEKVSNVPTEAWEAVLRSSESETESPESVRQTDLAELLKQIRDDAGKADIAAAVVLSDGRQTSQATADPRDLASQLRVPLYILPVGPTEMARDLILHHIQAPSIVIEKDQILIEGIVTAALCAGETCELQLLENEKVLETRQLTFRNEKEDQRFQFEVSTDKPERREFSLRLASLPEEHSDDNNSASVAVDVTDAVLRILIADSRARWEYQYLINLFRRQKQIEFDQLQFLPEPSGTGRREQSAELPQTTDEWAAYRLVILGDIGPENLTASAQETLREYLVQRGGSLIVIAGQNSMPQAFGDGPLQDLLPVESIPGFQAEESGYRIELTPEGRSLDAMRLGEDVISTEAVWREMSDVLPIYSLSAFHRPKPNSEVLLSASSTAGSNGTESAAFLAWQRTGAGRVAFLASPATYQLRMRNGDKYHHRFWGQFIRWMVSNSAAKGSRYVRVDADKAKYEQGDSARLMVELSDPQGRPISGASPEVQIMKGGEPETRIPLQPDPDVPGRYLGRFSPDQAGHYAARAAGADVDRLLATENYGEPVQVEMDFEPPLDSELLDSRADLPLLENLARQTGGLLLSPSDLAILSQAVSLEPAVIESSQRTPLWDRWWCLWVIIGCLTVEWIIRKKTGLA